jgi:flagellar biosynthesis/type III secretory pathway M-ring protein FliF/YscJ
VTGAAFDLWTVLLALGIVVTFASTVALIVGLAPARRAAQRTSSDGEVVAVPALPTRSASTVRDAAARRARAAAAAAGEQRAVAGATTRTHVLTDVHVVRPAPPGDPDGPTRHAAGQASADGDGRVQEAGVTREEADAIVAHFAEHDPSRIAEVITQWIRSDEGHRFDGSR